MTRGHVATPSETRISMRIDHTRKEVISKAIRKLLSEPSILDE